MLDVSHVQHDQAHSWFSRIGRKSFATCPITENGLVRIVGHPKYPNSPGPPSVVVKSLRAFRTLPGHVFWSDGVSVADDSYFAAPMLSSQARVTDSYLLALAHANNGRLASMDRKLATEAVAHGKASLETI